MRESLERLGRWPHGDARERFLASTRRCAASSKPMVFGVAFLVRPQPDHWHLGHLYIVPEHQARGIGTTVLRRDHCRCRFTTHADPPRRITWQRIEPFLSTTRLRADGRSGVGYLLPAPTKCYKGMVPTHILTSGPKARAKRRKHKITIGELVAYRVETQRKCFDAIDEALDQVASTVQRTVVAALGLAIRTWRDDNLPAGG